MRLTRKTYFVNPRLQLQLILGANILALISVAVISMLMFYSESQVHSYGAAINHAPNHPFLAHVAQQKAYFARMCLVIGVIQFLLFNLTAIFLSHRIAGPLYRLEHHLEDVASGKEPRDVKFRKGDLYQSLAEACNKLMARLREASVKQ
jgi:signal transduction histidine kinase